jgi:hypothetical protein
MIKLIKTTDPDNSQFIYCTPMENLSEIPTWFYFKFVNRVTLDEVETWIDPGNLTTGRYSKYPVSTRALFGDMPSGFWTYTIQPATTEDVVPNTDICESGLMYLYPATEFTPTKYDEQSNTFIVYGG